MRENIFETLTEYFSKIEPTQLIALAAAIIAFFCIKDVAKKWLSAALSLAGCLAILYVVAPDLYSVVWEWLRTAARQIFEL